MLNIPGKILFFIFCSDNGLVDASKNCFLLVLGNVGIPVFQYL
jgi:hypothetical protein